MFRYVQSFTVIQRLGRSPDVLVNDNYLESRKIEIWKHRTFCYAPLVLAIF
ncbi:hypothetical protein [Brasilonema sennae]|uniref:hypothetical protein n=1 Tax=Brasilonema sennae TaxID=1397703 RepID=UPI00155731AA|nr:hypothetical protein [Brasilonema sennae]